MGKKRGSHSYAGGALILAASNVVCRFLGFVFKVPLANLIGAEGMGYYGFALQIFGMASAVVVSGLPLALSTMTAAAKPAERPSMLRTALRLFWVAGGAGTLILLLGSGPISRLAGSPASQKAVLVLAPAVLLSALESAYRGYFEGTASMRPPAIAQLSDAVTKLMLGTAAAWYLYRAGCPAEIVAAGAVFGITAGTAVSAGILAASARSVRKQNVRHTAVPVIRKRLLRMACPLTLGALFLSLVSTADAMVIMNRLQSTGLSQSESASAYGAYTGIALTIYGLPNAVTSAICASVIPAIASAGDLKTKNACQRANRTLRTAFRLASVLVIFSAALFAIMPDALLSMLFSRRGDVSTAVPLLRLLAPAAVMSAVCSLSAAALHAMGAMTIPVIALAAGGTAKVVLNGVLIGNPVIRILGAPLGTVACFTIAAVINLTAICRRIHFHLSLPDCLVKPAVCAVPVVFLTRQLTAFFQKPLGIRLGTALPLALSGVLYLALLFVMGVLKSEDWALIRPGVRSKSKETCKRSE